MRAMRPLRSTFCWCLVLLAFVVLSLSGCGEENTAIVVALTGDQSTPLPLRLTSLTGMRSEVWLERAKVLEKNSCWTLSGGCDTL